MSADDRPDRPPVNIGALIREQLERRQREQLDRLFRRGGNDDQDRGDDVGRDDQEPPDAA